METKWLRGAHTFGTTDVKIKQSGKVQGRAAVIIDRSTRRLVRLMEMGAQADPFTAKPRRIHYKERKDLEEHNEFATKSDKQKLEFLNNKVKNLKRDLENLKNASQRRRVFMAPVILKQIDEAAVELIEFINFVNEKGEGSIIEINMGDLSEFKKEKKTKRVEKKANESVDLSRISAQQYLALVEEQDRRYAELEED
jgi:hypothetical protein